MPGQEAEHRAGRGAGFQREGYQPQVTTAELGALVGQSFNTLIDALKTGKTERLTSYLAFSGRFHRYSRRNQQLIFEQCPQATRVASYVRWKDEGYQVRKMDKEKGEKGISILRPIPPAGYRRSQRIKQLVEGEEKPADEYKETEVGFITRKFRVGTVFDVTHLIPEDQARVPEFFTTIEGDHDALYQRFIAVAKRDGIEVVETLNTEGARGTSGMGVVHIRPDQPSGNKAAVIAHELAHEYIHDERLRRQLSKQVKEAHAEATAFVVMSHFGITIPYSAEYLTLWGNTPETLRQELDVVTSAASQIITKVHALGKDEQQCTDEQEL